MPNIRIPQSADAILQFCRKSEDAVENACFDTYADLAIFAAACGFQRLSGRLPGECDAFSEAVYPIDLAVFKNQNLFPKLLLIGLASMKSADIARDEEKLCRVVEAFAEVGFKFLSHELELSNPASFHLDLAELVATALSSSKGVREI